jgi:hypothetical protein
VSFAVVPIRFIQANRWRTNMSQMSPAYLAFQEVMNALVSGERIKRVAQGSAKFLPFSDPSASRPMVAAVKLAARAKQTLLTEKEFDAALLQAEASVAIVPKVQMQLAF